MRNITSFAIIDTVLSNTAGFYKYQQMISAPSKQIQHITAFLNRADGECVTTGQRASFGQLDTRSRTLRPLFYS